MGGTVGKQSCEIAGGQRGVGLLRLSALLSVSALGEETQNRPEAFSAAEVKGRRNTISNFNATRNTDVLRCRADTAEGLRRLAAAC